MISTLSDSAAEWISPSTDATRPEPRRGLQHQRHAVGVTRVVDDHHSIAILLERIHQIVKFQERRELDATKLRLRNHISRADSIAGASPSRNSTLLRPTEIRDCTLLPPSQSDWWSLKRQSRIIIGEEFLLRSFFKGNAFE